ncbi:hypothetical protein [Actinoplanes awajinensis]|uniref:hypothetical protein n=1 Tax=Actinoplanes awajinensis TaxID=135946 RepID=UPI0012F9996A|nr:hypothetical protein [Actinoplanes awajinensis]
MSLQPPAPTLEISAVDGPLERETDRIADAMATGAPRSISPPVGATARIARSAVADEPKEFDCAAASLDEIDNLYLRRQPRRLQESAAPGGPQSRQAHPYEAAPCPDATERDEVAARTATAPGAEARIQSEQSVVGAETPSTPAKRHDRIRG